MGIQQLSWNLLVIAPPSLSTGRGIEAGASPERDRAALHPRVPTALRITGLVCVLDAWMRTTRLLSTAPPPRQVRGVLVASHVVFDSRDLSFPILFSC